MKLKTTIRCHINKKRVEIRPDDANLEEQLSKLSAADKKALVDEGLLVEDEKPKKGAKKKAADENKEDENKEDDKEEGKE